MASDNFFRRRLREHVRATQAGNFGQFDHVLRFRNLGEGSKILPGETLDFVFDIAGVAPFVSDDWGAEVSRVLAEGGPGAQAACVAARFEDGPLGDSAVGASDPVVGSVVTLSNYSSTVTAAADLDGEVTFSVSSEQLTVSAENTTAGPTEYSISELWFSSPANVSSLLAASLPDGWEYVEKLDYLI